MADNFFGITDVGKVRDNNEDTFIARRLPNGYVLACVIDGVGGYEGGEVAAAIAEETIGKELDSKFSDPVLILKEAVWQSGQNIIEAKQKTGANPDMACVLTVALVDVQANQMWYAHVGDTRMYLLRDGSLVKVTKDHSFVGFLEDSGRLSEREAMQHPKRNEINKALGFDGSFTVDSDYIESGSSPFLPGDAVLLCSDGLTDLVKAEDMTGILTADGTLAYKADALVKAANAAGGKDNVTVVLVTNDKKPIKQKATKPVSAVKKNDADDEVIVTNEGEKEQVVIVKKRRNTTAIVLLSLLSLGLAGLSGWLWMKNREQSATPVAVERTPNDAEKKFVDSLLVARGTFAVADSLFGKAITIGDTVFIRQDSLHIRGNGTVLQRDSGYAGPAFFITANNKYLLLENITLKDFTTAFASQSKGVQLRNVVFRNVGVPVQRQVMLPQNDTLTGTLSDTFLIPKETIR